MSDSSTSVQVPYLPTSRTYSSDDTGELQKSYFETAQAVNKRTIGTYNTFQVVTGNQYYSSANNNPANAIQYRQSYRKTFPIGPVATGATSTTAHGITGITQFVAIYGTCITDVPDYRPLPYASATAVNTQFELKVNATNITIISGAAAPNITSAMVVLEYLLN